MKDLAQHPALDQPADGVEQRVVTLHQVGDQEPVQASRGGDQRVGLGDGEGQWLLDDDVLAGLQRGHRLRVVEERRGGDVDEVHVVAAEQRIDFVDVLDPEPRGRGQRRGPVGAGHADQRHPRHLGELLEGEQPEPAAADHP